MSGVGISHVGCHMTSQQGGKDYMVRHITCLRAREDYTSRHDLESSEIQHVISRMF